MSHVEGAQSGGPARRLAAPAGTLAGLAGAVCFVAVVDPHEGHYPTCPFLFLTGFYCPGCGGLRMVNDLATGDPAAAFGANPLAFLLIPFAAYLWLRWAACSARGRPMSSALFGPRVLAVLGVVTVIFWIVRNLPAGHALAP